MDSAEPLRFLKDDSVETVVLNRPDSLNILDETMLRCLAEALTVIAGDEEIKVVILTGDRDFSAGADIKAMKRMGPAEAETFSRLGHSLCNLIEEMPKPVIAALRGYTLGGGCEIALACDFRIGGLDLKIGFPEVNLALIPGFGGTQRLPEIIGTAKARELILTGRTVDADEALRLGLVTSLTKTNEVLAAAKEMAAALSRKSPLSLRAIKGLLNLRPRRAECLEKEIASFSKCFSSQDHMEGFAAFIEKRKPIFRGI